MVLEHSEESKENMTKQMQSQIDFQAETLHERKKTVEKIKSYEKYNLPGFADELKKEEDGVTITQQKINTLQIEISRRLANGEINQVLYNGVPIV